MSWFGRRPAPSFRVILSCGASQPSYVRIGIRWVRQSQKRAPGDLSPQIAGRPFGNRESVLSVRGTGVTAEKHRESVIQLVAAIEVGGISDRAPGSTVSSAGPLKAHSQGAKN